MSTEELEAETFDEEDVEPAVSNKGQQGILGLAFAPFDRQFLVREADQSVNDP